MPTIGLVVRPESAESSELAKRVVDWAKSSSWELLLEEESARILRLQPPGIAASEIARRCDPVVTLGGDGTLLSIARHAHAGGPRLIGVNFGRLGFLTQVGGEELLTLLDALRRGEAACDERSMLTVQVKRGGRCVFASQALNDVVVQKASRENLVDLELYLDQRELMRIRGDGIVLSTPTGSTAYSLSAGGAIVHPALSAILVTPICPHSLTSRPLVLPFDSELAVQVPGGGSREIFVATDGQVSAEVHPEDVVCVTRGAHYAKLVRPPSKGYFEILRSKLNWGIPNRSE